MYIVKTIKKIEIIFETNKFFMNIPYCEFRKYQLSNKVLVIFIMNDDQLET